MYVYIYIYILSQYLSMLEILSADLTLLRMTGDMEFSE